MFITLRAHPTISSNTRIITLLILLFFVKACQIWQKNPKLNITFVVATHNVPNLVDLLPKEDFAFTMASLFIVVPMQRHVKPLLDVKALDSL